MDDLQFKINILEAKLATKQADLNEANNKLARAASNNSQIDQHKQIVSGLETKLATAEKQIIRLQNERITDEQKSKISRCDWLETKLQDLKKSEPQQKIDSLAGQLDASQNNHKETLQQLSAERTDNSKLHEQLKSFKYQASSPYNQEVRNQWRDVSIVIGVGLAASLIANLWMAIYR
jgi:chromosome condensin MukBEF ATPase and DNA-binding subunit MukB